MLVIVIYSLLQNISILGDKILLIGLDPLQRRRVDNRRKTNLVLLILYRVLDSEGDGLGGMRLCLLEINVLLLVFAEVPPKLLEGILASGRIESLPASQVPMWIVIVHCRYRMHAVDSHFGPVHYYFNNKFDKGKIILVDLLSSEDGCSKMSIFYHWKVGSWDLFGILHQFMKEMNSPDLDYDDYRSKMIFKSQGSTCQHFSLNRCMSTIGSDLHLLIISSVLTSSKCAQMAS